MCFLNLNSNFFFSKDFISCTTCVALLGLCNLILFGKVFQKCFQSKEKGKGKSCKFGNLAQVRMLSRSNEHDDVTSACARVGSLDRGSGVLKTRMSLSWGTARATTLVLELFHIMIKKLSWFRKRVRLCIFQFLHYILCVLVRVRSLYQLERSSWEPSCNPWA